MKHAVVCTWPAILLAVGAIGCAKGQQGDDAPGQPDGGGVAIDGPVSCGANCDTDGDGVPDTTDQCPGTPDEETVNDVGCGDSQLDPTLEPDFPPFGLTWTPTGDPGRAGGLTWDYTGIDRGDLFHIYWVICDDPATQCGLSLDGPIVPGSELWQFDAAGSDLPGGKVVFTNATHIALADTSTPAVNGRLTVTITDGTNAAIPIAALATLGVTGRLGAYGAEIPGTGFHVEALIEAQAEPYLDYYDAQSTVNPDPGNAQMSFGGSFYSE